MSRILFIGHNGGRTGAPVMLLHLLKWIKPQSRIGSEIFLKETGVLEPEYATAAPTWTLNPADLDLPSESSGKPMSFWSTVVPFRQDNAKTKLLKKFRRKRFDLIYSNTITNGEVLEWLSPLNIPVITHVHEMSYWIEACGERNLELVKKYTTAFLAASYATKAELSDRWGINADDISVVHEFIPIVRPVPTNDQKLELREQLGITPNAFVVTGSGFETKRKGKDLFVELAHLLNTRFPEKPIEFIWVGGSESESDRLELESIMQQQNTDKMIRFVGEVDNPMDYFGASDVFAMTSREDPYPLVCLESASLGVPIICFAEAGGMPEFVEDDCGAVVPFLDVNAMAEVLAGWITEPRTAETLGKNAARKVRERHDVNATGPTILKHVQSTLDRSRS